MLNFVQVKIIVLILLSKYLLEVEIQSTISNVMCRNSFINNYTFVLNIHYKLLRYILIDTNIAFDLYEKIKDK